MCSREFSGGQLRMALRYASEHYLWHLESHYILHTILARLAARHLEISLIIFVLNI